MPRSDSSLLLRVGAVAKQPVFSAWSVTTISRMCQFSAPPGYVRTKPPGKPKLGPLIPVIDAILAADVAAPPKPRQTAKRIFERLKAEHGFTGGHAVVKDYVRIAKTGSRETFVPSAHPPGHAHVDFGEAIGVIGGVRRKIHEVLRGSSAVGRFVHEGFPEETTEAFLDGHTSAFTFFGGIPLSILYDNTKLTVARICGDGKRERTRAFSELISHYLFCDRFGGAVGTMIARGTGSRRKGKGAGTDDECEQAPSWLEPIAIGMASILG